MALDRYANIAEIVGVIIVIVTLVFLALQIRQNTRALRSTTIQSVLQSEMGFLSIIVENADTWEKVVTGAPLSSGEETRKAILLYNAFMIDTESRYHQHKSGYLDPQPWEARLGTLPDVVILPTFELWRKSIGGLSHSAEFLELVDNLQRRAANERAS